MANLMQIHSMELANIDGKAGPSFMAVLLTAQERVKEYGFLTYILKVSIFIKDHMMRIKRVDMACTSGEMEQSMMDTLRMI